MKDTPQVDRVAAVERARRHAPFLRDALAARPEIHDEFVANGARAAIDLAMASGDGPVEAMLRRRRRALALAVALGDLSGELALEDVTGALTRFADAAIDQAVDCAIRERVPDAEPHGLAVLALGKLGSGELNYSSDVDLILLFDPETIPRRARDDPAESAVRIARRTVELLQARTGDGYVQRVDLRLRPAAEATPIVLSIGAAIAHYESSAIAWERAAFVRARAAAGDIALGDRFLAEIRPFVWRRALDFGAIDEFRQLSLRIRDHYDQGQALGAGFDLKRGRGGIREVEFLVQVQQLIHGGREPDLRVGATLEALGALQASGHLEPELAIRLGDAYRALRTIEHRAQMVDDQQTHRLPADPQALGSLARLDGRPEGADLIAMLEPHVGAISRQFDQLVDQPAHRLSNDPDLLRAELAAIGFSDVDTVLRRVADWRTGRARALRTPAALSAFEAMLPTLLEAIARAAEPAHALNRLADVIERVSSGVNLFRLLEARSNLAHLLALILAHAPVLADQLAAEPALLDGLVDASSFAAPPDGPTIARLLDHRIGDESLDQALENVRRTVDERRFAYGVQLISGLRDPLAIGAGYGDLAEGAIDALARATEREFATSHGRIEGGELVILALGRLGGGVLTHASDLDLIFLFYAPAGVASAGGARSLTPTDYYNRLASRIVASLSVPTAAGSLYAVDTRLRPEGAKGMLAVNVESFDTYQREHAWTWERMALCRARTVFGPVTTRGRIDRLIGELLRRPEDPAKLRGDAARMRWEVARHKPPQGPLDVKLGDGGLVDLEFAVHVLQLSSGIGLDPDMSAAIGELSNAGRIGPELVEDHCLLTRMLVAMRLVAPTGEPAEASHGLVARVCGFDGWPALLDAHAQARQRIAKTWAEVCAEVSQ